MNVMLSITRMHDAKEIINMMSLPVIVLSLAVKVFWHPFHSPNIAQKSYKHEESTKQVSSSHDPRYLNKENDKLISLSKYVVIAGKKYLSVERLISAVWYDGVWKMLFFPCPTTGSTRNSKQMEEFILGEAAHEVTITMDNLKCW